MIEEAGAIALSYTSPIVSCDTLRMPLTVRQGGAP
jgi:hypothetical protein